MLQLGSHILSVLASTIKIDETRRVNIQAGRASLVIRDYIIAPKVDVVS